MSESQPFRCTRCGDTESPPVPRPPFKNEVGRRVAAEICQECWEEWKERQMLLINHYGLSLQDPEARSFLMDNMRAFLFDEGDGGAAIDTSMEGEVSW